MAEEEVSIDRRSFKLKGRDAFYMTIIAIMGLGIFLLMRFSLSQWGEPFNIDKTFTEHRYDMTTQHTATNEAISELTYVMSLTEDERKKLRLTMPESLKKKQLR